MCKVRSPNFWRWIKGGIIIQEDGSPLLKTHSVGSYENYLRLDHYAYVMLQRSVLKIPKHEGVDLRRIIMEYHDLHIMEAYDSGCSKMYLCLRDWHTVPIHKFGSPNLDV
jgi:hypothetical protein